MAIEFDCPTCGKHYSLKDELAGKKGKCGKCGNAITIPQPPAAPEEDDEYRIAPLLDEELDSLPVAGGSPTTASPGKCPSCSADLSPEAVLCINCGFNLKTGKTIAAAGMEAPVQASTSAVNAVQTKTRANKGAGGFNFKTLARGAALSLAGALIGGGLWAGVAIATDYSLGILAWAIGGLAGAGMSIGHDDDDGTIAGIIAACMALVGIVFGKGLWLSLTFGAMFGDIDVEYGDREIAAEAVLEDELRSRQIDPDMDDYDYDEEYEKALEIVDSWPEEEIKARVQLDNEADRGHATQLLMNQKLREAGKDPNNLSLKARVKHGQEAYEEIKFHSDEEIVELIEELEAEASSAEEVAATDEESSDEESTDEETDEEEAPNEEFAIDEDTAEGIGFGVAIFAIIVGLIFAFGIFDIIFVIFALLTAYKVGSGKMTD